MKKELNISEILKNKPKGTRLYSPIFGECVFSFIQNTTNDVCVKKHNGEKAFFDYKGLYNTLGECLLFPSREMRDWRKFAWKKGDLLINSCGFQCIFKEWASDDYTKFNGCYSNSRDGYEDVSNAETAKFVKLDNNTAYGYIREIENICGGKLNLETLEIEKQPNFKDGDIVAIEVRKCTHIAIFQSRQEEYIGFHAVLCQNDELLLEKPFRKYDGDIELRPATDSEKQQLFDALAKEGKAWDSKKKTIVDLKQKWTPKPFDRVITRNDADDVWTANIFSHIDSHGEYVTIACVGGYTYCHPYNEEAAKLIGTTKDAEG